MGVELRGSEAKRRVAVAALALSIGALGVGVACSDARNDPAPSAPSEGGMVDAPAQDVATADVRAEAAAPDAAPPCDADVLTSPTNCGACGRDCLGAACEQGFCRPDIV